MQNHRNKLVQTHNQPGEVQIPLGENYRRVKIATRAPGFALPLSPRIDDRLFTDNIRGALRHYTTRLVLILLARNIHSISRIGIRHSLINPPPPPPPHHAGAWSKPTLQYARNPDQIRPDQIRSTPTRVHEKTQHHEPLTYIIIAIARVPRAPGHVRNYSRTL